MGSVMNGQDEQNRQLGTLLNELEDVLLIHGADQNLWPADMQQKFSDAVLQSHPELQKRLREEQAFEHLLNMDVVPQPTDDLRSRILANAATILQSEDASSEAVPEAQPVETNSLGSRVRDLMEFLWPGGRSFVPMGALAASIMGGVILGTTDTVSNYLYEDTEATEHMVSLAFYDATFLEEWQ